MKFLARLFLRDGLRKAIALLLALMLYFGISSNIAKERTINAPVKITLASGLQGNTDNITANIAIKAPESIMADLSPDDLTLNVEVNHNHLQSGNTYKVLLKPSMVSQKKGIKVKRCVDKFITLTLYKVISRQVPIEVKYEGKLNKNFTIEGTAAIPAVVTLTGAEDVINSIKSAATSPVPLSDTLFDSFEFRTALAPIRGVKIEPERITVQTSIVKKFEERLFKAVPVLLLSNSLNNTLNISFTNDPAAVDIVVSGTPSALAGIRPERFKPYIDASKINSPTTTMLPVECSSGIDGITIKSITPGELSVKATKK